MGEGVTVWSGTAFDCARTNNEISLIHTIDYQRECNNGAVVGRIILNDGSYYTSQLNVSVSSQWNNTTIICAYDSGIVTRTIGSLSMTITTGSKL